MTLDEQIAILQAAKEGKTIEWIPKIANRGSGWGSSIFKGSDEFNFQDFMYRIKQEPREWWAADFGPGRFPIFFSSKRDVEYYSKGHKEAPKVIKVREVIE